ncbi:MAG: ABC transporter substrate-binding protein [Castellaniella sp.]|uniref:ABC transporter substrate-binding protein n=1 Tax=Castellaniella sp. TaxID=1955812 RepID=UPI003A8994F6
MSLSNDFAPTGTLRASINLGNPLLARRDTDSGEVCGVSVDLAGALARELDVPLELVVFDKAMQSVEAVTTGAADIGFFAIDPKRGEGIAFTPPYVLIEGAYLVRMDAPLHDNTEVDQPGHRVVVGQGSAYDLYLSRHLQQAEIVRAENSQRVVDDFLAGGQEVAAGVRQQLQADADRVGGVRLLPGRFMVIEQAMGLARSRPAHAATALTDFVERCKASGLVAQALTRHGIQGASVAPALTAS